MLEPPPLQESQLITCLEAAYGLAITAITFLPLGADVDTAVYRIVADDTTPYFVKLRRGPFPTETVAIPAWLAQAGLRQLIPPAATQKTGALWTSFDPFTVILYPFVSGRSGWDIVLTSRQWREFGSALQSLHTAVLPSTLAQAVPHETYTPVWRNQVSTFLEQLKTAHAADPTAKKLSLLLLAQETIIRHIIARAELLAGQLARQSLEPCLCHGDIHAGNILVDDAGQLYLVDWDTLVFAPKERDLMFIGGGVGGVWRGKEENNWFYQGYSQRAINFTAFTYYRFERIVQDIAVTCAQLWENEAGGDDRPLMFAQLAAQFAPGNVVEIAIATDQLQVQ